MSKTVFKEDVVREFFKEYANLQVMWVEGDLETFYEATFVVDSNVVHEGDLIYFIYTHFDIDENLEFGPIVFSEEFMRLHGFLDTSFIGCKREDYV